MEDAKKPLKSDNLSCKVVDLAAGEARNLILTDATHSQRWKLQRHRTPSSTRFRHVKGDGLVPGASHRRESAEEDEGDGRVGCR
ncbi:hypothetical protein PHAVU_004G101914 [Phaseolus vulgaris]